MARKYIPPTESETKEIPSGTIEEKAVPEDVLKNETIPAETSGTKTVPEDVKKNKEVPPTENAKNCIVVNGIMKEIKPTRFRYFRNRVTTIYSILKVVPLTEFLSYDKGVFDEERDSDQILFDFMIAVFDDENFVKENYDDFTAEDFEKILEIFGRLNHIEEKEEAARKNREAQGKP